MLVDQLAEQNDSMRKVITTDQEQKISIRKIKKVKNWCCHKDTIFDNIESSSQNNISFSLDSCSGLFMTLSINAFLFCFVK